MSDREDRAAGIFEKAIIIDGHSDMLNDVMEKRDMGETAVITQRHLPRLEKGGCDGQIFAIYVEASFKPEMALKRAIQLADSFFLEVDESDDKIMPCYTADDFVKAKKEGKHAGLLGMEGAEAIASDVVWPSNKPPDMSRLHMFYKFGLRHIGFTWQQRNQIADGVGEAQANGGLTNFGIELVKEVNSLGMVIDLAHIAQRSYFDVLEVTEDPLIVSHTNCMAVWNHERCITDEQIYALAENDGVMGVCFYPAIVDEKNPGVEKVLDHVDHVVELVGIDHVGWGADFADYINWSPNEVGPDIEEKPKTTGLEDVTKLPNFVNGLIDRGYSDEEIIKVLGGNFLRVFKKVLK
jgi:membrane dipeptidase